MSHQMVHTNTDGTQFTPEHYLTPAFEQEACKYGSTEEEHASMPLLIPFLDAHTPSQMYPDQLCVSLEVFRGGPMDN